MSTDSSSKPVYTAYKAWSGGGSGFTLMLLSPVGVEPNQTTAAMVLLTALFSPWTGAAIDVDLLDQAIKALWLAIFGALGISQAVYWTPNKVKGLVPIARQLLEGYQPRTGGDAPASGNPSGDGKPAATTPLTSIAGLCLAAFLMLGLLGGCSVGDGPVAQAKLDDFAQAADEDRGAAQKLADRLLGEASGPDHRGVRLCMIFAGVSELMTDRVTHADPDYAAEALGHMTVLSAVQRNLDASGENVWFETDVKLATLELTDILIEVGEDRVPRLLSNLTGGVNVLGVVDRARVAARQAELAGAVIRDTRALLARVAGSALSASDARAACEKRLTRNQERVSALLGAN